MLKIIKVTGESLSPFFLSGDYVLLRTSSRGYNLKKGDVVVFNHPQFGRLIKQVQSIEPTARAIRVKGTHPASLDPIQLGSIPFSDIIGKVIWHIKQPLR
jgi:signal peptidase I